MVLVVFRFGLRGGWLEVPSKPESLRDDFHSWSQFPGTNEAPDAFTGVDYLKQRDFSAVWQAWHKYDTTFFLLRLARAIAQPLLRQYYPRSVSISLSNIVRFIEITMCVTTFFFSSATGPIYANFWSWKKVCRTLAEWLEGIPFYEWPRGSRASQRGFDRLTLDTRYK